MAKKNDLRKQVKALEALAGFEKLSKAEAKRANGGRHKHHKKGTGAIVPRGTGAVAIFPGTGAVAIRGSGAVAAPIWPPKG
jgi:hypothetical protein